MFVCSAGKVSLRDLADAGVDAKAARELFASAHSSSDGVRHRTQH